MTRRLLVTSALPYANGDIHIGHLVEHIQTDIFVRFQRMIGNECLYVCADDTHGTPVMLSAKAKNLLPEDMIQEIQKKHIADFTTYHISHDHYYTTHSSENQILSEEFFLKSQQNNAIISKDIQQLYCETCQMFLPDRFIRGTCPHCTAPNQYGDACEVCFKTYDPTELKDPKCAHCQSTPVIRSSTHFFFKLAQFESDIKAWLTHIQIKPEIQKKLDEWFTQGLKDWDITRDAPYFGFKIPGTTDKYFYVWMDAPIGYISTTQNWCNTHNQNWETYWKSDTTEIHHFIGKDILYFHTLFWPALLKVAGYTLPHRIHIHGFLTVNGEKMSKSRGTFVTAKEFAQKTNPEFLRYYYASKLSGTIEDIDLNLKDFVLKVNADVINKVINIGSRLGSIITKKCEGHLSQPDEEGLALIAILQSKAPLMADYFESLNFRDAMKTVMELADQVNQYIDQKAPWALVKEDVAAAQAVCTTGLNGLKILSIYLKPVLPKMTEKIEAFLNIPPQQWADIKTPIINHNIQAYTHIAERLKPEIFEE